MQSFELLPSAGRLPLARAWERNERWRGCASTHTRPPPSNRAPAHISRSHSHPRVHARLHSATLRSEAVSARAQRAVKSARGTPLSAALRPQPVARRARAVQTCAVGTKSEALLGNLPPELLRAYAVFLGCLSVVYLAVGALAPTIPLFSQSLGLGDITTGVVISAPAGMMLLLNLSAGRAADTRGRKPLMVFGLALVGVADFATASSTTLASLVAARLSLGAGRSFAEAGERAFVADVCAQAPEARGRIVAAQQSVYALGFVLGPLLGGAAVDRFGPAAAFYAVSFAALGAAATWAALLPETLAAESPSTTAPPVPEELALAASEDGLVAGSSGPEQPASAWNLARTPAMQGLLFAAGANSLNFVAKVTLLPTYAAGPRFDASAGGVGALFSFVALVGLAGAPLGGVLADRFGQRAVVAGSISLCAVGLALAAAYADNLTELFVSMGVWGLGAGMASPSMAAQAQTLAPAGAEGLALTLPKSVADLAFFVGPVALGAVAANAGPEAALAVCAGTSAVSAAAFLTLSDESEDDESSAN
mmetsp:Transcript_18095/g.59111  ORF Transcript_18095/g.59111 Transcript_18095/m.59111 type:complete len:538 (-) Transcript_18095:1013-2626(-)